MTETPNNVANTETEDGVCSGCLNQLTDEDYVSALGQEWHMECFRCSACDAALSSWYFEKDGLLFCQADYWARYGESCQQCTQVITGPVMAAGDHRFHPECFCCELCSAFIGDGEAYALIERSKLYCGSCYERVMRPLGRSGVGRHAIQLVEVPPRSSFPSLSPSPSPCLMPPLLRLAPDPHRGLTIKQLLYAMQGKLAALVRSLVRATLSFCLQVTKYSVDVSCGLMALHIGDRILEINGTPVKDQPIPQIEHLICYSDTVLQLTIEHDPDSLAVKNPQHVLESAGKIQNVTHPVGNCEISPRKEEEKMQMSFASNTRERPSTISVEPDISSSEEMMNNNCTADNSEKIEKTDIIGCEDVVESNCKSEREKEGTIYVKNNAKLPQIPGGYGSRDRAFRRRAVGEEALRGRQAWRKAAARRHFTPLGDKERSSSMSRLLDGSACEHSESCEGGGVLCDLSRTRSFRVDARPPPTVFRAADLLQGELLGSGFFGQVFKVTHRDTNEVMVLKQLYRVDEDAQKNFLKEVAVLRSLSHPNVLRFIGVLYKERRLHLVTEFISGGTLRNLLEGPRAPPWAERAGYARDIAAGLAYLHAMNVIHRDLNSHNCLVREDKTVIVADFGLARIVRRTGVSGSLERSQRGSARERKKRYTVVGNPYWMAPEMMKGNVYDEKVDVFSFGIVLCEIIGRVHADPDFLPRSSDFGLNQSLFRDTFCQGCPEHLYSIAFLCCNLNPDRRPPFEVMEVWLEALTMHLSVQKTLPQDLLTDILQYVGPPDLPSPTPSTSPSPSPSDQKRLRRNEETDSPLPTLCKSKSGDVLELEAIAKTASLPDAMKLRGLGPKCISASHLCLPNKTVEQGATLSKSQNALASTPAGYILSTDDKTINITKVDDVREWIDRPIILRRREVSKETSAEKRQSVDDSIAESEIQNKARKIVCEGTSPTGSDSYKTVKITTNNNLAAVANPEFEFKKPDLDFVKVLKSKSHNCNTSFEADVDQTDTPSYLRIQSVEELETENKMIVDVPQSFRRNFSIPDHLPDESSDSDDLSDEVKTKVRSPSAFRRIFKNEPKTYTVNPEQVKQVKQATDNGKRKTLITNNIKMLQQNFEANEQEQRVPEKSHSKPFNILAKKLMSPKLGRKSLSINKPLSKIFNSSNSHQISPDDQSKSSKSDKCSKGKSTFFVTTPQPELEVKNVFIEPCVLAEEKDSKSGKKYCPNLVSKWSMEINNLSIPEEVQIPPKPSVLGKCMTPLLRRHNRLSEDSVGRYSYREKRSSPIKYVPPDKNSMKLDLVKCDSKFDKSIPIVNIPKYTKSPETIVNDCKNDIAIDVPSPLARCGNLKNIPQLNRNKEIDEVDSALKQHVSNPAITENGKCLSSKIDMEGVDIKNGKMCPDKPLTDSELGISSSNYVSLANLRINCPSLGRTRESLVKRNISKFDGNGRYSLRAKRSPEKCAPNVDTTPMDLSKAKSALQSTAL